MENQKCTKTKRLVLFGVLTILTVLISWHIYAHFLYKDTLRIQYLNKIKEENYEFTSQLYEMELKDKFNLLKVNFQGKTDTNSSEDEAPESDN